MGEMRNAYKILVAKLEEREHLRHLGIDGRIILNYLRDGM
jgi:hypothetical protein